MDSLVSDDALEAICAALMPASSIIACSGVESLVRSRANRGAVLDERRSRQGL